MEELETETINNLDYMPHFYKRYVDDCILCIPEDKLEYTHSAFNSYHARLQFTIEKQKQNSLSFLDILLKISNNGKIETNWFTKSVWSQRYLNFESNVPNVFKKSVVISLTDRAIRLADGSNRPEVSEISVFEWGRLE